MVEYMLPDSVKGIVYEVGSIEETELNSQIIVPKRNRLVTTPRTHPRRLRGGRRFWKTKVKLYAFLVRSEPAFRALDNGGMTVPRSLGLTDYAFQQLRFFSSLELLWVFIDSTKERA